MSNEQQKERLNAQRRNIEQRLKILQAEEQRIREGICQKYGHVFSPTNFEYLYDAPKPSLFAGKHAMYEVTERCLCCGLTTQDMRRLSVKYVQNAKEAHLPDEIQKELKKSLLQLNARRDKLSSRLRGVNVQLCALSW